MSCFSALLVTAGTPAAPAKDGVQVLPEGSGVQQKGRKVCCLEGETEERDQATSAETSQKAIWSVFYSSTPTAPNSLELQLHLFCRPCFPSPGPRNHFLHGRRLVGDPGSSEEASIQAGQLFGTGYKRLPSGKYRCVMNTLLQGELII